MTTTTISHLAEKHCQTANKNGQPLRGEQLREFGEQLGDQWRIVNEHHLEREFEFKDFREALNFTNRIGEIAEEEFHHPDLELGWGKVGVKLFTHNINGLSENDFILAAKIEALS